MPDALVLERSAAEIADPVSRAAVYDRQWAALGDFIRYNPGACHRRRLVRGLLRKSDFRSVLDVGCGPGEMLLDLARRRQNVDRFVGADFAPEVVGRNRVNFPGLRFEQLDIERDHLPELFDLVVCSEVLEHLHDRRRAFQNLACMVRPGGRLLVTCPTGRLHATERHFGHTSHPSADELRSLAAANDFRIEQMLNWGWPAYRLLKLAVNVRPEFALRKFGAGQYSRLGKILNRLLYLAAFASFRNSRRGCQLVVLMSKVP